jgi:hypothetical protein
MTRSFVLFLDWAIVGFIGSFALLYGFTPVGPIIVLLVWLASRYLPRISGERLPEAAGALGGFGAFWLFVATTVDGDTSPIVALGAMAAIAAIAWYVGVGHRRCRGQRAPS